jgi:putative flippase GtrA
MTRDRLHEIIRFLAVGGGCFLLDYGLLFILTAFAGVPYLISSGISFTVSLVVNYILCVSFVFRTGRQTARQTALFVMTSVAGLAVNQFCMWFLVEQAGLYYMVAKIGAAAIVTLWNYVTKRLVLKQKA